MMCIFVKQLPYRTEFIILLVLAMLTFFFRLPSLDYPWDNDSGAIAYGGRIILAGEPLYSTYHPGHHLPAAYYTYALAFKLLGDSHWAVKFFLILWTIPTVYLLYWLGTILAGKIIGLLGSVWFLMLSSELWLKGNTAEIELFANLPRLAAILLLVVLLRQKARNWTFVFIGFLGAICILFKAIYFSPLGVSGIILFLELLDERTSAGVKNFVTRILWMLIGLLIGLLSPLIYFASLGLLPRVLLVFYFGRQHVGSTLSPFFVILYPLLGMSLANAPLFLLGLAGALLSLTRKDLPSPEKFVLPTWLALTLIETGFSRKPWPNYYLLLIPPISLLGAWFFIQFLHAVNNATQPMVRWSMVTTAALIFIAIPIATLSRNFTFYKHYLNYKLGQETYREFVINARPDADAGNKLIAVQDTADYINAHSAADDRIYLWGNFPQLYYMANRRCALDTIWYTQADVPYLSGGVEEIRHRILAPATLYVVVTETPPDWLAAGLDKYYSLEKTFGVSRIYRRIN